MGPRRIAFGVVAQGRVTVGVLAMGGLALGGLILGGIVAEWRAIEGLALGTLVTGGALMWALAMIRWPPGAGRLPISRRRASLRPPPTISAE